MRNKIFNENIKQSGNILVVIMVAVAIFTALILALTGGVDTTKSTLLSSTSKVVVAQASLIRARILQCGIEYPTGNNGTAYRISMPAATTAVNVSSLICPGSAVNIWAQTDGVSMPPSIDGVNVWTYTNDVTSLRISLSGAAGSVLVGSFPAVVTMLGSQSSITGNSFSWVLAN